MTGRHILLAAGGTGGHIFPAEAVAGALARRGHRPVLVCDTRARTDGPGWDGIEIHVIAAASPGGNLARKARAGLCMAKGYYQARRLVRRLRPALAIGFGGYPSAPSIFASARAGVPVLLHEQNAVMGRANRALAAHAAAIATGFAAVSGFNPKPGRPELYTGNPVRAAIEAIGRRAYPMPAPGGELRLLVVGGSQGAAHFSAAVPEAIARLPEPVRRRLTIAQQCRAEDLDIAAAQYRASGAAHELAPYFTDMPRRLSAAHLVIARAGASTVSELAAAGRPAILVPLPGAADDHQTANARAFAGAGGGWIMGQDVCTPEALAARLQSLAQHPLPLARAAEAARGFAVPDATDRLADFAELVIAGNRGGTDGNIGGDTRQDRTSPGPNGARATSLKRERAA